MVKTRRTSNIWTAYVDLLTCLMVGIFTIFMLTLTIIAPKEENKKGAELKAEYIISISWDVDSDVDLWVEDPLGNKIWFKHKEAGFIHLDFDSMGSYNNRVELADGSVIEPKSYQEVATLRGIAAGEYTVNVHLYGSKIGGDRLGTGQKYEVPVTVKIQKLNPTVKTVFEKVITLEKIWQEKTATRFTLNNQGEIISMDDTPKQLLGWIP